MLDMVKAEIVSGLKLEPDERITPGMKSGPMGNRVREFFRVFGLIQDLKKERRKLYRHIAALKKNWFGFLANVETELAQKYHAAIVREDLTVEAIEKDDPQYKGRTFNKMINNGSKGQYQRRASQAFRWNGVPEVVIPSWYTSRSCLPHSVIIEKRHRKGESIFLPCCGVKDHADEHAADTIACYPFLVAKASGIGLSM
jgi:Transposase and inactivated derivatives